MKKIAFVILNYMTANDTEKCIESIMKNCNDSNYKIYIIDNCSPDNSGSYLKDKYISFSNIETIICESNLGFANGNNVGFLKAKYEYKADFIVLCNSDTQILTSNFCSDIINKYSIEKFAVMGPKELLPDGSFYPLNDNFHTVESLKKYIINLKRELHANNDLVFSLFYNTYKFLLKISSKSYRILTRKKSTYLNIDQEYKNIILHGFFLIFSKDYIEKYDGLDDRTFFYGEEDLLALRLKRDDLISIYYPKIVVFHNSKSATNARSKNKKEKNKFVYENLLKSAYVLLDDLENYNNEEKR